MTEQGTRGSDPVDASLIDPDVERRLRERLASSAFHRWAGMELERVARGEVDVVMRVEPHHLNLVGMVHGGMLATLADTAAGLALRTVADPSITQVTGQMNIHYLAPAKPGRIVGRGRAVKRGSRMSYAEADIVDATGTLLARATATFIVRRERAEPVV